jgi:hypothetical protein
MPGVRFGGPPQSAHTQHVQQQGHRYMPLPHPQPAVMGEKDGTRVGTSLPDQALELNQRQLVNRGHNL